MTCIGVYPPGVLLLLAVADGLLFFKNRLGFGGGSCFFITIGAIWSRNVNLCGVRILPCASARIPGEY
jgi:hypothetical protein